MTQGKIRKLTGELITWLILGAYLIFTMVPIIWFLLTSIKPSSAAQSVNPFQPFTPTFEHYIEVFGGANLLKYVWNSVVIAGVSTILALIPGFLAAYSFARLKNKFMNNVSFWILSNRMLPPIAVIIPLYMIMARIKLLDTYAGMIAIYLTIGLPYIVWTLMSYIEEIPVELEEAGVVDGCSKLDILRYIILPIAMPGIVATGIFVFVLAWSEFLYAVIITSNNTRTLPVVIASFVTDRGIEWGEMSAAGSVLILPLVVLFYSVQRFLVRGLSFGAVKG